MSPQTWVCSGVDTQYLSEVLSQNGWAPAGKAGCFEHTGITGKDDPRLADVRAVVDSAKYVKFKVAFKESKQKERKVR